MSTYREPNGKVRRDIWKFVTLSDTRATPKLLMVGNNSFLATHELRVDAVICWALGVLALAF
jgi:hypothetical protein